MEKILLLFFGLAALASTASAEPIPMTDDQLDLVVAGLSVTYNGQVYFNDTANGALYAQAPDGSTHILSVSLPDPFSPASLNSPEFLKTLRTLERSLVSPKSDSLPVLIIPPGTTAVFPPR